AASAHGSLWHKSDILVVSLDVRFRGQSGKLGLSAFDPEAGRQQPASCLLEREDCTLLAWYRFLYAPRTGGAYDSHHRTAGIAGCTRRRGSVAARGARAAAGNAGRRISRSHIG